MQNGVLHRDDGPAWLAPWGYDRWLRHGQLHREDGPAQVGPTGYRKYLLSGVRLNRWKYDLLVSFGPDLRRSVLERARAGRWNQSELGEFLGATATAWAEYR